MIELTARAAEVLAKAAAAARRFNPDARVRVRTEDNGVSFELADSPSPGDLTLEHPGGFSLYVEAGLDGFIHVEEPHDRLVLRADNH